MSRVVEEWRCAACGETGLVPVPLPPQLSPARCGFCGGALERAPPPAPPAETVTLTRNMLAGCGHGEEWVSQMVGRTVTREAYERFLKLKPRGTK